MADNFEGDPPLDQDPPLEGDLPIDGGEGQLPEEPVDRGPWYYAQLDQGGVCVAVTQAGGPIDDPTMLRLDALDADLIGSTRSADAWLPAPAPSPTKPYIDAVDAELDRVSHAHGYDGIVSACSYAAGPNPWQTEGLAFLAWRGACWTHCHAVFAQVQANTRPVPTPAELVAELPAYVAP